MTMLSRRQIDKKLVLVIDDDEDAADYVKLLLIKLGYSAKVVHDGLQGMEAIVKAVPDCILLDLEMPVIGGFDFLQHRKKVAALRAIPVAVLTNSYRKDDVDKALGLGANGYVTKPVDERKLAQRLDKLVPSPLFGPAKTTSVEWPGIAKGRHLL
jgi:CheY-like chemotaxis protein